MEMKREAEEKMLYQMAKVHDFLEMWQGSQNLWATQKKSCVQNLQMTAVEYISGTEEIIKTSWSNFEHDCADACKMSEKSPVPPALSTKDLPEGQTQVLNVGRIKWIDRQPAESDEDSSPECISDTANWLNWNGNLDHPNDREDNWEADNKSDMELDNGCDNSGSQEQWNVSAAQNVPRLIRPIKWAKKTVQKELMTVNIIQTRRNKRFKKK